MKNGLRRNIGIGLLLGCLTAGGAVWWGYAHLTTLVQARLRSIAGDELSVGKVTARWNRVELEQVKIARHGAGPFSERLAVERVTIRPSLLSLFNRRLDIGEIVLEKPHLLVEIAPDGSLVKIIHPHKASSAPSPPALPLRVSTVRIEDGSLDILDWQVGRKGGAGLSNPRERYHLVSLQKVCFQAGALDVPFSARPMPVRLDLKSKGGGTLTLRGDMAPKGLDAHLKLDITDLDITRYRPYFLKPGDLNVTAGKLSAACTISISKRNLNAPGTLRLKGLALDLSGARGVFMGVPATGLLKLMSDSKDDLSVAFSVKGNLDNPRFAIQQSLVGQVTAALASKLGAPTITSVGKGIIDIGGKGIKALFGSKGSK